MRPYQAQLLERVRIAFSRGARRVVMQLPTGGGKTHVAAGGVIAPAVARGRRVLFLAHLDALIEDTHAKLTAAGIPAGFIQADRPTDATAPVQVGSLATLHRRPDERPAADLVIVDECHRALAESVRAILAAYPSAWILGLTATPQRGDGQPLGDVFDAMVCGPAVREMIPAGHLVAVDVVAPGTVQTRGLAADPIEAYERWAPGSRAIVFAESVAHAEELRDRWLARGVESALLIGETPADERRKLRERMTSGTLRVIVNVNVAVEGFDLPAIETVVLARAFTVCGGYLQAIGRGMRPSPGTGKARCTVIDLRGAALLHGLPDDDRIWSLEGDAVRRAGESLIPLRRCTECLAIYRPAVACPRCGARVQTSTELPRVLNRAEKLQRFSRMSPEARDAKYLEALRGIARVRLRLPDFRIEAWALSQFRKRFHREPATRAA